MLRQRHVVRLETRPAEHRRQGRGPAARARHQRPAHAARSHHRRRGPRRGSARHAAGHEHRPRRQLDDHPRQQPARRAVPPRHDGGDGQPEHPGQGRSASRSPRPSTSSSRSRACRTARARSPPSPRSPAWRGDVITMQDIFVFEQHRHRRRTGKVTGRFRATGIRPKCSERLAAAGMPLPLDMFEHVQAGGVRSAMLIRCRHLRRRRSPLVLGVYWAVRRCGRSRPSRTRCAKRLRADAGVEDARRSVGCVKDGERLSAIPRARRGCCAARSRSSAPLQRADHAGRR